MASYIQALVIQQNNDQFVDEVSIIRSGGEIFPSGIGKTTAVPCPDSISGGVIDADYWATPVNDGTVSSFTFTPYNVSESVSTKPDIQSFAVVRISSTKSSDRWWLLGTSTQYLAACAVCCSDSPVPMPDVTDIPDQVPCQTLCEFNTNGLYFGVLALPSLGVAQRYYPSGYFNGAALPTGSANGYATTGALLTFLNTAVTGWATVGTWTISNGIVLATQSAGPGTDVLCASIVAINPSA